MNRRHPHARLLSVSLLLATACGGGDSSSEDPAGAGGAGAGGQPGQGGKAGSGGGVSGASGQGGEAGSAGAAGASAGQGGAAGSAGGTAGSQGGGAAGSASGAAGSAGGSAGSGGGGGGSAGGAAGSQTGGAAGCAGEVCAGTCVDTSSDAANCGACGKVCGSNHASAVCLDAACVLTCHDGFADCDGSPDNGCEVEGSCACKPGQAAPCYEGPAGTEGVGVCLGGQKTCKADGTGYDGCVGQVMPGVETCANTLDDDCDGQVNEEGEGCACVPGSQSPCYSGPSGTQGVGPCQAGTQTCKADGTGYGECAGQVMPQPESCLTPLVDDDCDGQLNEEGAGCACVPGATQPCYEGPVGTSGFGVCKAGVRTCASDGTGYGACVGQVVPGAEVCDGTLADEDCDGVSNEEGAGCACAPGDITACYEGPAGTQGVGDCKAGYHVCNEQGTGFGPCVDQVVPSAEVCNGSQGDENCNGQVNEGGPGCVCKPGTSSACYSGPAGTQNVGLCKSGTRVCNESGTGYGACVGEVVPQAKDFCSNTVDDDCNGTVLTCGGSTACNAQTGDCVDACDPALLGSSYQGCVYYPTVTPNLVNSALSFAVAVSNTSSSAATVTITRGATQVAQTSVAASSVQIIKLPWDSTLKGPDNGQGAMGASVRVNQGAYKLVSTRPVTVYQYSPLEYQLNGVFSHTNDASLLLPVNAWTGNYRVMSRHQWSGFVGFMTVVASQDNTVVTTTAGPQSGQIKAGVAGIGATGAGTVTLNAGDVITLVTNGGSSYYDPNDPTGMLVTASKPVQVIGGHECTNIPDDVVACDHLEESMFPLETLAKEYLVTSPWISSGVTKAQMVRVMATRANTTLSYDPPQAGAATTIAQAGGWIELPQTASSFKITASEPILVSQYMIGRGSESNGDPAMALAVTTAQYRNDYLFHAPTNYSSNFVNITAPTGATVTLDGVTVGGFTAIGGSGYGVARVQLSNTSDGNHSVTSTQPCGITVYGYGFATSYWYPGGLDLKPIQN